LATIASVIPAVAAASQQPSSRLSAVVTTVAPIYIGPKVQPIPLRTAAIGTRLEVLVEEGDWVQVRFGDPVLGPRVGWVEAKLIRIERPELQPLDLSVPPEQPPSEPRRTPRRDESVVQPLDDVDDDPNDFDRGWIDVNFGLAFAAEENYSVVAERIISQERARFEVDYSFPTGANFDFGGGVMITRNFGLGISFNGTAHVDSATVRATIPHPTRFNAFDSDEAETPDDLMKVEGVAHIQAVYATMSSGEGFRARLFGGPSFFQVRQDTIDDIRYSQVFQILGPANEVTITSAPFSEAEADAWGFHAGADFSTFFTRVVGVGGLVRYSYATVDLVDLGGTVVEVKAGGFQVAGGLRLKF
jgi:hypothetical protein